jgi:hypothetical protein
MSFVHAKSVKLSELAVQTKVQNALPDSSREPLV